MKLIRRMVGIEFVDPPTTQLTKGELELFQRIPLSKVLNTPICKLVWS